MNKKKIIIGARGSKLAVKYAELAIRKIKKFYNGKIELKKIVTKGDRVLNRRTSDIGGKGEFVKNIEKELIAKKIDIAVHSLKDIPYKDRKASIDQRREFYGLPAADKYLAVREVKDIDRTTRFNDTGELKYNIPKWAKFKVDFKNPGVSGAVESSIAEEFRGIRYFKTKAAAKNAVQRKKN